MSSDVRTVVGAAILDDLVTPTSLLVARRKPPKSLAGYWEFAGGKVEDGETEQQALARELQEELGVTADILDRVTPPDARGWPLDNGMFMQVYTALIVEGTPEPLEDHDLLEWTALNAEALQGLQWIPADRPIVDALLAQLGVR